MATTPPARRQLKASQVVLILTLLFAALIAASGIAGAFEATHDPKLPSRETFWDIPHALRAVFYTALIVLVTASGWLLSLRVQNWERGQPDRRTTTPANLDRRLRDLRRGLTMQTLLRDPAAGLMHSLIYFPFLVLFAITTTLEINHLLPDSLEFLHGHVYQAYKFIGDTAGGLFVIGIGWAAERRYIQRPDRLRTKTRPEDALILSTFFVIGATGLVAQAVRIAAQGQPSSEKWTYIGYGLSYAFTSISRAGLDTLYQVLWGFHIGAFLMFLVVLPTTKLRHMLTSPANMFLRDRERPKGAMKALPHLTETELESFGAARIEDFTWKQLMDTDSCTICGRCTAVCPARNTGKLLDPWEIVNKIGNVMAATRPATPVLLGGPTLVRAYLAAHADAIGRPATIQQILDAATDPTTPSIRSARSYHEALARLMIRDDIYLLWAPATTMVRNLADPSLAAVLLGRSTSAALRADPRAFRILFTCLALRDLRAYADHHWVYLSALRDRATGHPVCIMEEHLGRPLVLAIAAGRADIDAAAGPLRQRRYQLPAGLYAVLTSGKAVRQRQDRIWEIPLSCLGP